MADPLTMRQASESVTGIGWRYLLGTLRTSVRVNSLTQAAQAAAAAAGVTGADGRLSAQLRFDRVVFTLQTAASAAVTAPDVELAHRVSEAVGQLGLQTGGDHPQPVQLLEIAIDAIDIAAIRPFWKAVLWYEDEPGGSGPTGPIADPTGQGPTIWFQQMDAPRPQRNRIHLDISVPHDEAQDRLRAALAAGGQLVTDEAAPAFWVLADAEGNEACITTWQGRE